MPDFLVIGHLVKDVTRDGWRPGGTVLYASLVASRLGMRTAVLISAGPEMDAPSYLPNAEIVTLPSTRSTIFENVYKDGSRTQFVRSVADDISLEALPKAWRETPVVLLGPVIGEVDDALAPVFAESIVGLSAQGWLRAVDSDGRVQRSGSERLERLLLHATVVFASEEDTSEEMVASWAQRVPVVAYTQGNRGVRVWHNGEPLFVPAIKTNEVDPTGAGDSFAAAFLVRWRETGDALESARFACACASFVVEAEGPSGAPTREQVEERLMGGRGGCNT